MRNFHLCFKKVSSTAGWRTNGVEALVKNGHPGDFSGGPVVKILPSNAGGRGPEFNPWVRELRSHILSSVAKK